MARKAKVYPVPADQSVKSRKERFYRDGSCPIHDAVMGQVDGWYYDDEWGKYTLIGCGRNGCRVVAKAFSISGPWELLEEHAHLIEEGSAPEQSGSIET